MPGISVWRKDQNSFVCFLYHLLLQLQHALYLIVLGSVKSLFGLLDLDLALDLDLEFFRALRLAFIYPGTYIESQE